MNPTSTQITLWKCAKCGMEYRDEDSAKQCGVCNICGQEIHCRGYCSPCNNKREKEKYEQQFEKAELIEYKENFVFCPFGTGSRDGYFESMDELIEHLWDNYDPLEEDEDQFWPKFVFATDPIGVQRYDLSDVLEHASGDMYEDFDAGVMKGQEELQDALNAFYEKNTDLVSYQPDYKKKIRVPTYEELKKENDERCLKRANESLASNTPCPVCGLQHGIATIPPEIINGEVHHPNLDKFGGWICGNELIQRNLPKNSTFIGVDAGVGIPDEVASKVRSELFTEDDLPVGSKPKDNTGCDV